MRKMPVACAARAILATCQALLIIGVLCFTAACMSGGGARSSASAQNAQGALFKEWQIIDTKTGQPVSLDQWAGSLLQQDIIYLGEEHHNRFHIDAALTVLRWLKAGGRTPALAMEMFGWDGQAASGSICFQVRHGPSGIPRGSPVATELGWPVRGL